MATLKNLLIRYLKKKFKNNFYENGYNSFTIHGKIKKEEIFTLTKITSTTQVVNLIS